MNAMFEKKRSTVDPAGPMHGAAIKTAGRMRCCVSMFMAMVLGLPLMACEREQGNPLPQTPPKPRVVDQGR
ncbi:MAG: hypothetical protein ACRYGK_14955 [Janthinobacterium lividum]